MGSWADSRTNASVCLASPAVSLATNSNNVSPFNIPSLLSSFSPPFFKDIPFVSPCRFHGLWGHVSRQPNKCFCMSCFYRSQRCHEHGTPSSSYPLSFCTASPCNIPSLLFSFSPPFFNGIFHLLLLGFFLLLSLTTCPLSLFLSYLFLEFGELFPKLQPTNQLCLNKLTLTFTILKETLL